MNNNKLIQNVKKSQINQLESELNELTNLRREYELQLDNLIYDIKEYLKIKEQILSNVKQIKKEIGDSKKIKKDLEMFNLHIVAIIERMNKDKYFECTIEEYKQALEHKRKDFEEEEKNEREEISKLKKEVKVEINKILKNIKMTGGRKLDTSLKGINNAIIFKKTVVKYSPEANYDIIEKYYEMLKNFEAQKDIVGNTHEALNWIKKSETWLPNILNMNTLQNCKNELQQNFEFIEKSKQQIGIIDKKVREKEKNKQLEIEKIKRFEQVYEEKKKRIEEEKERISKIKSFDELKMTREEAMKFLNQEETSYMVIPIPENVMKKSELFNYFKEISIETDETKIDTVYQSDTLTGVINSNYGIKDEKRALLVKLNDISLENIARINSDGTMLLTKFEIPDSSILITHNENASMNEEFTVLTFDKETTTLKEEVKEFLKDDFTEDKNEYKDYSMFQNFEKKIYTEGEKNRIAEIIKVMHANYFKIANKKFILDGNEVILSDLLREVIGKTRIKDFLNMTSKDKQEISSTKIEEISANIDMYINDPKRSIEVIYKQLLQQYLKDNPKARAFYNDERNTKVKINGKIISMKPKLPQYNEELENRLFRKEEDKIYKEMKTAALCNKLAHLYDKQLKDKINKKNVTEFEINQLKRNTALMFNKKHKLIRRVIKKSQNKKDISIGEIDDKRGTGIAMDIPGYTTIVLHVGNDYDSIIRENVETYTYIDGKSTLKTKEVDRDNYITTGIMIRRSK